jgi:uncharacterized protein (TIRG00374 family)
MRRTGLLLTLAAFALALAVPLVLGGRDGVLDAARLPIASALAIVAFAVSGWIARGAKQWLLVRRLGVSLGFGRSVAISLATDAAFLATPAGGGGYLAHLFLLRRAHAPRAAAAAIVAADQALDLVFFAVAMPLAALASAEAVSPWMAAALLVCGGGVCATIALAFVARRSGGIARRVARACRSRWPRIYVRALAVARFAREVAAELGALARGGPALVAGCIATTALQWIARYGVLWLIVRALGAELPFGFVLLLQGLLLHAAQWTGVPAGAGGADLGLAAALAPTSAAGVVAPALLLWRAATLYLPIAVGVPTFAALVGRRAPKSVVLEATDG